MLVTSMWSITTAATYLTGAAPVTMQALFLNALATVALSISFGQWLGYSLKESDRAQDVTVKDKVISDVKVVTVPTRYTILVTKDRAILIVPTADVSQFKSEVDPALL